MTNLENEAIIGGLGAIFVPDLASVNSGSQSWRRKSEQCLLLYRRIWPIHVSQATRKSHNPAGG